MQSARLRAGLHDARMLDGTLFVFDTETVEHRLTFGAFEEWRRRKLVARAVFYADAMPEDDPEKFELLRRICEELDVRPRLARSIFQQYIWPFAIAAGQSSASMPRTICRRICRRVALGHKNRSTRQRYCNGVALTHAFPRYTTKNPKTLKKRPRHLLASSATIATTFAMISRRAAFWIWRRWRLR